MKRVLAIAKKDLRQGIRNRYIIGIVLLSVAMSAFTRFVLSSPDAKLEQVNVPELVTVMDVIGFTVSMSVFTPIGMLGAIVMPLLMVEEKELQTLRFLRISPASMFEILMGKALLGVAVCMTMGIVAIVLLSEIDGLISVSVILVLLLASVMFSGVGLLASAFFHTALQSNTWSGLPFLVLLAGFIPDLLPPGLGLAGVLKLLPSYSASALMRGSLSGNLEPGIVVAHVLYLLAWIFMIFALTIWLYRRAE